MDEAATHHVAEMQALEAKRLKEKDEEVAKKRAEILKEQQRQAAAIQARANAELAAQKASQDAIFAQNKEKELQRLADIERNKAAEVALKRQELQNDNEVNLLTSTATSTATSTTSTATSSNNAIYCHQNGQEENVQIVKAHSESEGGGYTIFIPSLNRERMTEANRLKFQTKDIHGDLLGLGDQSNHTLHSLPSSSSCLPCNQVTVTPNESQDTGLSLDDLNILSNDSNDYDSNSSSSSSSHSNKNHHNNGSAAYPGVPNPSWMPESSGEAHRVVIPPPPPPPTSSQQSPRSPASPTTSKRLSLPDSEIAKFPISNLIHLICGQHLIPRHLSGGLKKFSQDYSSLTTSSSSTAAEEASASSSQTSDNHHEENLIPMPLFALPETLRVLLSHLANKHEANVILKLINAPSPHCGLTPLQLLLRSRGISSPSVASAALLLLIGGCDMFSLDPQGHSIASTIADGLQTHLQRNPLTWYHEDSENIDILSSNKTTNKNMKKEEQEEDDEDGPSHVVIGTMLLVTKGRLAFIGGGDRERSVHFVLIPDKRGIVHNGLNYKGPFLIGLRVKKDELRVSTIAHSSSVKKIDTKNGPIGKRGERIYDAYPIQIENATIEGEDEKPLCILTNQLSERLIWGKYLNKAFHMNNSNNKKSSSSKQSENEKELFGNHANKKGAGAGGGGKRGVDNSANETVDLMNANRNALLERGEKLNELADKTQELSDTASEFEKMCKELEKQQRNRWF
mmetsp:Transcript_15722/g.20404  ORF Transcript_15722/g.20404 Transcript_15722/m.20404 type:complete len:740 (+) Transcript_15722:71-2290(+)